MTWRTNRSFRRKPDLKKGGRPRKPRAKTKRKPQKKPKQNNLERPLDLLQCGFCRTIVEHIEFRRENDEPQITVLSKIRRTTGFRRQNDEPQKQQERTHFLSNPDLLGSQQGRSAQETRPPRRPKGIPGGQKRTQKN